MLPEYETSLGIAMILFSISWIMKMAEILRDEVGFVHHIILFLLAYGLLVVSLFLPLPVMIWFALMAIILNRADKRIGVVCLFIKLIWV